MPRGRHSGKQHASSADCETSGAAAVKRRNHSAKLPAYVDIDLDNEICGDLNRRLQHIAAVHEFAQTLHDTLARLQKHSTSKPDPKLALAVEDAIAEQMRSAMTNR